MLQGLLQIEQSLDHGERAPPQVTRARSLRYLDLLRKIFQIQKSNAQASPLHANLRGIYLEDNDC